MTKICTVCKVEKDYSSYAKKASSPIGIRSECKACAKEYQARVKDKRAKWSAEYYANNKEKISETTERCRKIRIENNIECEREKYNRAYYRNIEYYKARYVEKRDMLLASNKKWKATKNGLASKVNSEAKRRAFRNKVTSSDSSNVVLMLKKHSTNCYYCGELLNGNVHIDHYIPLSKGGGHTPSNLVASCPSCNLRKHNTMPIQFIKGENYGIRQFR